MMEPTPIQEIAESLIEYNRARFKEEVSIGLFDLMCSQKINRTRLAEMLGVQKSRISHMFTGSQNFRLDTIADAFLALGRAVHLTAKTPTSIGFPTMKLITSQSIAVSAL